MSDEHEAGRWKHLGEPIHAFDNANGVTGDDEQVPDEGESEVDAAIRRTGQANIAGLGGF